MSGEQAHGAHGMKLDRGEPPQDDESLEHPKCVFQVTKRHFARYTPELVEQVCGVPREKFLQVAEWLCDNSGPERTGAVCYAVGWTQHTHGVQNIRAASILQLLLGNVGRPGGGVLALRGHANIQGSTDIPTLYNILPSYIPMPHPQSHRDLETFVHNNGPDTGATADGERGLSRCLSKPALSDFASSSAGGLPPSVRQEEHQRDNAHAAGHDQRLPHQS